MARPSIPKSTRMSSAIRTIAWPSCRLCCGDLTRVLGTVDRICGDDDSVADNLLDDRSQGLEVVPEGHLERLIVERRDGNVTAHRGGRSPFARGSIRDTVAGRAGVRDENPTGVRRREL